ncbi:MAG: serine/threonine protein kinase [Deltaproteobacteria bacterium]|nr:serine/threonine protein kinase [Deltaproteobacteria bacterium]
MSGSDQQSGVGTRFGKFLLLKKLASGGMGEIFLAKQSGPVGFEKILVIKRILQHHLDNKQYVDMFFSEARIAAMLSHSNVVQVYDMGEVDEHLYIAMEYVHGRSIKDVITRAYKRQTPIPLAYVVDAIGQACSGLSYSHNLADAAHEPLNIIHRDINPHNLLISYAGDLKIIDFGIAKSTMSVNKTETGTIKGKFVYMSPEQSAAEPLDKRSDIFSLTIVLYEMLAGFNPFHRDNIVLSLEAIQRKDPSPVAKYREDAAPFDAILKKGFAKDRNRRYSDCTGMREDLDRLLLDGAVRREKRSLSEYLEDLFADCIAEDRQVLLETGSGIGRSLVRKPVTDRRRTGGDDPTRLARSDPSAHVIDLVDEAAPTRGLDVAEVDIAISDVFADSAKHPIPSEQESDFDPELRTVPMDAAAAAKLVRASPPLHHEEATKPVNEIAPRDETTKPTNAVPVSGEETRAYDALAAKATAAKTGSPLDAYDLSQPLAQPKARLLPLMVGTGIAIAAVVLALALWRQLASSAVQVDAGFVAAATDAAAVAWSQGDDAAAIALSSLDAASLAVDTATAIAAPIIPDAARARPDTASTRIAVRLLDAAVAPPVVKNSRRDAARPDTGASSPDRSNGRQPVTQPPPVKRALGTVTVNPGRELTVSHSNRSGRGSQAFQLYAEKGRINVYGGSVEVRIRLDYTIVGDEIRMRLDSTPWTLVSVGGGQRDKTPIGFGPGKRFNIELNNPQFQTPLKIMVFYTHGG